MNGKQIAAIIIDFAVLACTAICLYLLYQYMEPGERRNIIMAVLAIPVFVLAIYEIACWSRNKVHKKRNPAISTLVLLGEDDRPIRIWDLTGKVGILIGKGTETYAVDIDLSETSYETFIDPEHAVINYSETGWWLQDTSSRNGVSIFRKGEELLLGNRAPIKIEPGDIICLAKYTRIAVN